MFIIYTMKKNKKIHIAILAPVFLPIPPKKQGGSEWIVYHQANGLVDLGFDVTLFAVKGSKTKAKLVPVAGKGVRDYPTSLDTMESSRGLRLENTFIANLLTKLIKYKHNFDIIFNHTRGGEIMLPLTRHIQAPIVHVLHLPLFKEVADIYQQYRAPLVSISNNQREGFKKLNYAGTVYNGVDASEFTFNPKPKDYVFCIATIGEHKNTLDAVLAAKKAQTKLILAGKIRDQDYFEKKIKPHIDGKKVQYKGEIGFKEKIKLYRNSKALLFPTKWQEPFGLVAIEALACGTPVIAYKNGALPEIIDNGVNGFLTKNVRQMALAIKKINNINRHVCRQSVEKKFTTEIMVSDYAAICHKLTKH